MIVSKNINRMIMRDEEGNIIADKERPYQLEIIAGKYCFTTPWYSATDEESEQKAIDVFAAIAANFTGEELCQTQIEISQEKSKTKSLKRKLPEKKLAKRSQSKKPRPKSSFELV